MTDLPDIDSSFLTIFLVDLLNTPSPTGNAEPAIAFVEKDAEASFPELTLSRTRKGALVARWEGRQKQTHRAPSPPMSIRWARWSRRSNPMAG